MFHFQIKFLHEPVKKMSFVIHEFFWDRYFTGKYSMFKFLKAVDFAAFQIITSGNLWDPDALAATKIAVLSFKVLKPAAFFSELEANVFFGVSLKFKPVLPQSYICSGVKPSFFTISKNLRLNHFIWVGSAESFSLQMPICQTPCRFLQWSNHLRLAAKFRSPPIALFRDIIFSWRTGPLIGDPFLYTWVNQ